MVGIFSRFSVSRNGHRRAQSALDDREAMPPNSEATGAATVTGAALAAAHGIEVAVEFKPLEHPTEPFDNDRPIQCPLPEPSILNRLREGQTCFHRRTTSTTGDVGRRTVIDDHRHWHRMIGAGAIVVASSSGEMEKKHEF